MGWNKLLLLVAICVFQCANGQGCQCDNAGKESKFENSPVLVMSPTEDKSFPDEENACFMEAEKLCQVPVAYTGKEGNAMGFQPSVSDCVDLENGYVAMVDNSGKTLATINNCGGAEELPQLPSHFTVIFNQTKGTGDSAKPMQVVLFMQPIIAATTTTAQTTTELKTTTTYSGNMTNDPTTFEIDLAVAIDSSYFEDALPIYKWQMREFGKFLVDTLEVHSDVDVDGGSRLSLVSLTANQGGLIGSPWTFDKEDFQMMVRSIPLGMKNTGKATYIEAIKSLLNGAFTVEDGNLSRSRKRAQRVLVVIAYQDSKDDAATADRNEIQTLMDNHDVWPILVKFSGQDFTNVENTLKRKNDAKLTVYSYNSDSPKKQADHFIENYILNGRALCGNLTQGGPFTDKDPYVIKTANYEDIKEGGRTTGQRGRYCNYEKENVTVTAATLGVSIRLKVVYELEVEQDYLRIYDGDGKEQAAFTGFDVEGSEICFKSDKFTINFTTNQKSVFGGFKIEAYAVNKCPTSA